MKLDFGSAASVFRVYVDQSDDFPWIHLIVGDNTEVSMTYHHALRLADALYEAAGETRTRPHMHPHGIYRYPEVRSGKP